MPYKMRDVLELLSGADYPVWGTTDHQFHHEYILTWNTWTEEPMVELAEYPIGPLTAKVSHPPNYEGLLGNAQEYCPSRDHGTTCTRLYQEATQEDKWWHPFRNRVVLPSLFQLPVWVVVYKQPNLHYDLTVTYRVVKLI